MALTKKVVNQTGAIREFEKPKVSEAIKVANANKWTVCLSPTEWDEREARLKKEYEKNHIKCGDPILGSPSSAVEGMKLQWKDNKNTDKNPALAEAASQFNDSLLDEQAKKIEKLTKENEDWKSWHEMQNRAIAINNIVFRDEKNRLGKEIARLNKIIHKKNMRIEELRKESSRHLEGKMKMFGENFDLEQMLKDKNAVLADVAEELRLSKIREKNLTELCQKYIKANEELKEKLADKVVDKIDAQALKSAESALAWKEKVIAEKDEVIADLGKELAETKKEMGAFKESYKRRIKEDSECFEHIQKICNVGLQKWLLESEYLEKDKPFRFRNFDIASGKENKKPRIPTPEEPKHYNSFKDFISKTIDNFNRRAAELGCVGSKDGNGILDQMVGVDIAEEGGDRSATIVECGKDIDDVFEEIKRLCQE